VTRALIAIALVACGSSRTTSSTAAAPNGPAHASACPATFALARGTCTSGPGCTYPEGTCACAPVAEIECSGGAAVRSDPDAVPPPPPSPPALAWQCTPAVRADGCPGTEPEGTCTTEGKQCRYGACCVSEHTCKQGQWTITMMACPP
jgi:hypothetical protein